jgi:hypothetical protein
VFFLQFFDILGTVGEQLLVCVHQVPVELFLRIVPAGTLSLVIVEIFEHCTIKIIKIIEICDGHNFRPKFANSQNTKPRKNLNVSI